MSDSGGDARGSGNQQQALRGGKTRRGANFQTPASPVCSEPGSTPAKRRGRRPNNFGSAAGGGGPTLRGSEPKDNSLSDLPSPTDESAATANRQAKRGRSTTSGASTPVATEPPSQRASPDLLECPEPQCMKKFQQQTALQYHLKTEHRRSQQQQQQLFGGDDSQQSEAAPPLLANGEVATTAVVSAADTVAKKSPSSASTTKTAQDAVAVAVADSRPPPSHLDLIPATAAAAAAAAAASDEEATRQRSKKHPRKQSNPVSSQQKQRNPDGGPVESAPAPAPPVKEASVNGGVDTSSPAPVTLPLEEQTPIKLTSGKAAAATETNKKDNNKCTSKVH